MQVYTYPSHSRPKNTDRGYPLEPPRRGGSNVHPQSMFRAKIKKNRKFSTEIFHFLQLQKSLYIAWASFRNVWAFFKKGRIRKTFHHGFERMWHITINRVSAPRGRRSHVAVKKKRFRPEIKDRLTSKA